MTKKALAKEERSHADDLKSTAELRTAKLYMDGLLCGRKAIEDLEKSAANELNPRMKGKPRSLKWTTMMNVDFKQLRSRMQGIHKKLSIDDLVEMGQLLYAAFSEKIHQQKSVTDLKIRREDLLEAVAIAKQKRNSTLDVPEAAFCDLLMTIGIAQKINIVVM